MYIYICLLIPIIFSIVLYIKYKHQVVWWEYLINFGVAVVCIFLSKAIIEKIQITDTEYWTGWVKEVQYYENWDEYINETCTESYSCGTDSKGNTKYCTRTYDCSYVDYHSEYWKLIGSNGESISIDESIYLKLKKQFGNNKFVDMHRDYHSNDGDMYKSVWDGSPSRLESLVTEHFYDNRVRVSSSTYALQEPSKEIFNEYNLFHYPEITDGYKQKSILGYNTLNAEKAIQILNAKYGKSKEFKTFILVFKNKDKNAGYYQEEQWQGGNKNELNITIGIDDNDNVKWCHVFSWTDNRIIVVDTRTFIENQKKLNLIALAKFLDKKIPTDWQRKEFSSFEYLTVEPKTSHIIISFIIVLIINFLCSIYVINNEITEN